jgi:rod shape-determining protein MreC
MHNLLRFIKINQFLLLFILIEGVSITLLLQNNSFQASKTVEFSTQYISAFYNSSSSFSDYLELKETNDYLVGENAKLHSIANNTEYFTDSLLIQNKNYNYIPTKVINNSVNKRNNFITLNKGSKSGIKNGMGVITNEGVIGVVHSVSKNYSLVLSLLHKKAATGIFLKKNMHTGILKWQGFDYRTAVINDLPVHIPLNKGDTIITNSYSNIYPEGVNIGTIANFTKNSDDGFYTINISLFEDFNNLKYVYVVNSTQSEEQLKLEQLMKHE